MRHAASHTLMTLAALALIACDGGDKAPADTPDCVPSRAMFDKVVGEQISGACGTCHGATPEFGAPSTLTGGYESLISGKEGERAVDRIVARMANKSMPPPGGEPIPHQVQDTVVEWASCGETHPDHSVGLVVDRPVFHAPKDPPKGVEHFDLTAGGFAVGKDVLDLYQCFTFEAPVQADRFIRRIEVLIDQSKVLHHVVLLKDPKKQYALGLKKCKGMPKDSQYLYAWAPGAGALQFPEGGLRIKPKEHYIVQIHYNNGAGIEGVKDSSGVRLYHGPTEGTEYGMVAPGPLVFSIPGHSTFTATGHCKVPEKTTVLAGMPHMHELGKSFEQVIVRADGTRETLVSLTGWSFEMQPFYHHPAVLEPGDRVETSCTWRNDGDDDVPMGEGTADEMCFNFMYVTPPPKDPYCNDFHIDANADVNYIPGSCAAAGANAEPPLVKTPIAFGSAPEVKGGDLGKHRWELTGGTLVMPGLAKSFLDVDKSVILGRGQAWTDGQTLTIDAQVRVLIAMQQGAGIDSVDLLSMGGDVTKGDKPGHGTWTPTCGGKAAQKVRWHVEGDTLTVVLDKKFAQYTVPARYDFKRVAE